MSSLLELECKTVTEFLTWGCEALCAAGIEEAQEETERMLAKLLNDSRSGIHLNGEKELSLSTQKRFLTWIERRKKREPLAYVLGEADFWQETLLVNQHCLIPRPETEILVERTLKLFESKKGFSFLDIGTGSGAIAIALLRVFPDIRGTLLDLSGAALEVAKQNVNQYGLTNRACLVQGNLFEPFPKAQTWDLVVSNPPYLSERDMETLQEELKFEPREALAGGKDGLDFYQKIIFEAKKHLSAEGWLVFEVGQGQAATVSKWLQDAGYDNIQRFKDYLGIERVVMAQYNR